ncbi:MAG: WG repeat-containing protein, partial [Acidobacteria bacterium]|nr:WG repeat-containing protein [Acidobacteriota bacterium]
MKLLLLSVRNSRRFLAVIICSLLLCCLAVQKSAACSWDYLIWINQNKKADPLYRFLKDGKAGYIDRNGKVVIQPRFKFYSNSGGEFHEGLMRIDEDGIDYVDATGKPVALKDIAWGFDFSEGLTPAKSEDENRWGFINRTGKFVISPRFEDIPGSEFSEGMAAVKADGRYGYIDHTGQFIIAPKFVFAADFQDGMARVILEGNCSYFEDGPCSFEPVNIPYTMTGRLAPCQFTFINKSGSLISATGFEAARDFSEGLAAVRVNHKWGFIDKQGRFVIKPQFEAAKQFSDGLARFKQGDLWGYIN